MDGIVSLSGRKGYLGKVCCTGTTPFLDVLLQITTGTVSAHQLTYTEFLVGEQRWEEKDVLGIVGGDDQTEILGRFGFS
jgi:hypothetical protein